MDVIPFLSAVILIATVATILLAVLSYAAFKFRDRRKPKKNEKGPIYFRRYLPSNADPNAEECPAFETTAGGDAGA